MNRDQLIELENLWKHAANMESVYLYQCEKMQKMHEEKRNFVDNLLNKYQQIKWGCFEFHRPSYVTPTAIAAIISRMRRAEFEEKLTTEEIKAELEDTLKKAQSAELAMEENNEPS